VPTCALRRRKTSAARPRASAPQPRRESRKRTIRPAVSPPPATVGTASLGGTPGRFRRPTALGPRLGSSRDGTARTGKGSARLGRLSSVGWGVGSRSDLPRAAERSSSTRRGPSCRTSGRSEAPARTVPAPGDSILRADLPARAFLAESFPEAAASCGGAAMRRFGEVRTVFEREAASGGASTGGCATPGASMTRGVTAAAFRVGDAAGVARGCSAPACESSLPVGAAGIPIVDDAALPPAEAANAGAGIAAEGADCSGADVAARGAASAGAGGISPGLSTAAGSEASASPGRGSSIEACVAPGGTGSDAAGAAAGGDGESAGGELGWRVGRSPSGSR
jgi:hypothetical protein